MQSRFWIGTSYREPFGLPTTVEYGVYQRERCPTTSREHSQWFVVYSKRRRFPQVQKDFPGDHVEAAKCPKKAREYCMKEESRISMPVEVGSVGAWAKDIRGMNVVTMLKEQRVVQVLETYPDLWRSTRQLKDLRFEFQPVRSDLTRGILFTGSTGTGKTKCAALISAFVGSCYWKNGSKWWNGYDGEDMVIWDEFRGSENMYSWDVLRLLDRTPYQVESKGGVSQFNSRLVLFCSNRNLADMYQLDEKTMDAVKRRIHVVNFK
nr:MAG: replication associated protein [Cressdnaviricota sp.]